MSYDDHDGYEDEAEKVYEVQFEGDDQKFDYLDPDRSGKAHATFANGDTYEGGYSGGKRNGHGVYTFMGASPPVTYVGGYKDGLRHGAGKMGFPDKSWYEGEWLAGRRHGDGTYQYSNGDKYVGGWRNGKKHGKGRYSYAQSGCTVEGIWSNGCLKHGAWTRMDRSTYKGLFLENAPCGKGLISMCSGLSQDGEFTATHQWDPNAFSKLMRAPGSNVSKPVDYFVDACRQIRRALAKHDHSEDIFRLRTQVEGVPNFRVLSTGNAGIEHPDTPPVEYPFSGSGQPSVNGIRGTLERLAENGFDRVLWVTLRSDPVAYVGDAPYSPRNAKLLNTVLQWPGMQASQLAQLDDRWADRLLQQARRGGKLHSFIRDTWVEAPHARKNSYFDAEVEDLESIRSFGAQFTVLEEEFDVQLRRVAMAASDGAPGPSAVEVSLDTERIENAKQAESQEAAPANEESKTNEDTRSEDVSEFSEYSSSDAYGRSGSSEDELTEEEIAGRARCAWNSDIDGAVVRAAHFDAVANLVKQLDGRALHFSCVMGRINTTTALVVAGLTHRALQVGFAKSPRRDPVAEERKEKEAMEAALKAAEEAAAAEAGVDGDGADGDAAFEQPPDGSEAGEGTGAEGESAGGQEDEEDGYDDGYDDNTESGSASRSRGYSTSSTGGYQDETAGEAEEDAEEELDGFEDFYLPPSGEDKEEGEGDDEEDYKRNQQARVERRTFLTTYDKFTPNFKAGQYRVIMELVETLNQADQVAFEKRVADKKVRMEAARLEAEQRAKEEEEKKAAAAAAREADGDYDNVDDDPYDEESMETGTGTETGTESSDGGEKYEPWEYVGCDDIKGEKIKLGVDVMIDRCDSMVNLRELVHVAAARAEESTAPQDQAFWKGLGLACMERYYYLLLFQTYLMENVSGGLEVSFVDWLRQRKADFLPIVGQGDEARADLWSRLAFE